MPELDLDDLAQRATDAAQAWAPGCRIGGIEVLPGGAVSLVYTATVSGGPAEHPKIVLKVAPPGLPPVRNRDVLRQGRCMDALGHVPGLKVPPVLFSDAGAPVEVPPFFATGLLAGECVEPLLSGFYQPVDAAVARERAFAATRMLAAQQAVRPADIGLGAEPELSPTDEVERWTRTLETVPDDLREGYRACADALIATAPAALPPVVVHGDYRLGNMLIDGTDITGIIDWELWTPSDPRIDLTWLLFFTDDADHPVARDNTAPSGMPSQGELLALYEDCTGRKTPDLDWFHAMTWYKEAAAMALITKHIRRNRSDLGANLYLGATTELIARAHKTVA
jgi:aminoglycoside phosphotransferase (APT) family kinase protein